MQEKLLKIINNYGVLPQLKYFQSEIFELNEAIIRYEEFNEHIENLEVYDFDETEIKEEHIAEEIADVLVMLKQIQYFYKIEDKDIEEVMNYKIERQLERIKNLEEED